MARQALLIGVNRYLIPGSDLRGCVNDVKNLKSALTRHCGFKSGDIEIQTDAQATTRAMRKGIEALVKSGREGDVLLLHYSGHGSNVPDDAAHRDEADGRDEILCPHDLDWQDPLRDDWLRVVFDGLADGVALTVIMDCCHSGSNTRAIQPPDAKSIQRYLPSPWEIERAESRKRERKPKSTLRKSRPAQRRNRDVVAVAIKETLITGCRDDQTSADAWIAGSFNGALTHHLVAAIEAAKGKLTARELHARTAAALKKGRYSQVPQLEGPSTAFDRPFLAPVV